MLGKGRVLAKRGMVVCKLSVLLLAVMLGAHPGISQELPEWKMDSIRLGVKNLLNHYQLIHNQINATADPAIEREFINLFSNPKVLIVNEIDQDSPSQEISAQNYVSLLPTLFPEGLILDFNMNRILVSRPKYDFNNRYLVNVWLEQSLMGISKGKALANRHRIVVTIGFNFLDGKMSGWEIWGIALPPKSQTYLTVKLSPSLGSLVNQSVDQDERFNLEPGLGYAGGVGLMYLINSHLGGQLGIRYAHYQSSLTLDHLDPHGGFDPHLEQVNYHTRFWFVEMPIGAAYKITLARRLNALLGAGISPGVRLFESFTSSAVNSNSRSRQTGVISDSQWIDGLTRFNLGFYSELSIMWQLRQNTAFMIGVDFHHGLTSLGEVEQPDYVNSRYQGLYNPIWRSPDSNNLLRSLGITIGVAIQIESKKE